MAQWSGLHCSCRELTVSSTQIRWLTVAWTSSSSTRFVSSSVSLRTCVCTNTHKTLVSGFWLFCFVLRQFSWLAWISLQIWLFLNLKRLNCLSLPNAGIKGVHHPVPEPPSALKSAYLGADSSLPRSSSSRDTAGSSLQRKKKEVCLPSPLVLFLRTSIIYTYF